MHKFIIYKNNYLYENVQGFYHEEYCGGGNWKIPGTIENLITTLKNDIPPYKSTQVLQSVVLKMGKILKKDLLTIKQMQQNDLTVCVTPRAKSENHYSADQLFFKVTVRSIVSQVDGLKDGTYYIQRHTNTRTTHRDRSGHGGDGDRPYLGITKDTCTISERVRNKHILLIDDLYTKTINIDEDAIQALLDCGAKSVIFYAPGKTVHNCY